MNIELSEKEYWRTLRKQKRIKLRQIAEELHVSIPFISMYENDKCDMSDKYINIYKNFITKGNCNE